MNVEIYTHGACSGNPGLGNWTARLEYGQHQKEISGVSAVETTNNRMELTAILNALQCLKKTRAPVIVHSHSMNAVKWLTNTQKRKNPEIKKLCEQIDEVTRAKDLAVTFQHLSDQPA